MSTLAEYISSVTNPTPKELDPEDDVNIETVPKIKKSSNVDDEAVYTVSELRRKTAPLLEDVDPTYAGKKVSRKSLDDIFHNDENTFVRNDEDSNNLSSESENSQSDSDEKDSDEEISDEEDSGEEISDGDLENFKSLVKNQQVTSDGEDSGGEESDESEQSGISDDIESSGDMVNRFSNIDVTSEAEKGAAVKAQLDLWNRLCECRIKLQKLLLITNKLPQADCWKTLKKKGGDEVTESLKKGSNYVKLLMNNCLNLQTELLERNPEITNVGDSEEKKGSDDNDDEIPSNTDEEMETAQENQTNKSEVRGIKRKLKCEEYSTILTKRHKSLIPYRNSVIQKWDEKTRISFGRVTQKSFSAFDSSALKKIEQVLQDESRLIKRTQLKRSLYRVLGKPDATDLKSEENAEKPASKQDMLLRDYDPEIFDDDDFYGQLLKDIIESKSVGMNPAVIRKQMEIQSIRNKMKRKVDTKASKGRKIRYDVHPKLVNFMAPVRTTTISDEARDNLLKCLFGRNLNASS